MGESSRAKWSVHNRLEIPIIVQIVHERLKGPNKSNIWQRRMPTDQIQAQLVVDG